jgi:hypothetical protein
VPPGRHASLLDDPNFLAELEQIDIPTPPGAHASVVTVGDEQATLADLVDAEWSIGHPEFVCEARPVSSGWSIGRIALALIGFLLMMGVGGVAATIVFHSRVARILTPQPISAASASSPATGSTPR